jgi:hypothetical protein
MHALEGTEYALKSAISTATLKRAPASVFLPQCIRRGDHYDRDEGKARTKQNDIDG